MTQVQQAPRIWCNALIHGSRLSGCEAINQAIAAAFDGLRSGDFTRRTHYFGGRYENLYLERDRVPEIDRVLTHAQRCAQLILSHPAPLRCGFWLNAQDPGQATSEHNHEENDELLSGVYYVEVPPDSGDLVLLDGVFTTRVTPAAGMLLFFPPTLVHRVEINRSSARRLSLAFNFGPQGDAP